MSRRVTREWNRSSVRQTRLSRSGQKRPWRTAIGVFLVLIVGVLIGRAFNGDDSVVAETETIEALDVGGGANYKTDIEDVLSGSVISVPLDEAIVLEQVETQEADIAQDTAEVQVDAGALDAVLTPVNGARGSGTASSAFSESGFQHVVVATLPDPPVGYYYEGWLIRSTPFNFLSTGRFIQHADDLKWYLLWSSEVDHTDYGKVVVTIEPDDGDKAPSDHVLEGQF